MRVMVVFGTRPEAIKLGCLVHYLRDRPDAFTVVTCVTAQHRRLLDQVLGIFDMEPDYDLGIMKESQTLEDITAAVLTSLSPILKAERPDIVLVQGDTTTTLAAAMAAFYAKIPIGHVEAGLRTPGRHTPFPEQMNRLITTQLSDLHFAPTQEARQNLLSEGIDPSTIAVVGNTVIDSLFLIKRALDRDPINTTRWSFLDPARHLILVTAHRRENLGAGLESICMACRRLAARSDVQIIFPVHPNPRVRQCVSSLLSGVAHIHVVEALDYAEFVDLFRRCRIVLTDSGGIQEEAPALGKPTLVLREQTERPEAVEAGSAILVGTNPDRIFNEAVLLLEDKEHYRRAAQPRSLYGDGRASERIADVMREFSRRTRLGGSPVADGSIASR